VELHLRAAEAKTAEVVGIGAVTLVLATVATVPALHLFGLPGAAVGVLLAEAVQLGLLLAVRRSEGAWWAVGASLALLAGAALSTQLPLWWLPALAVPITLLVRLDRLRPQVGVR
jgi:hypothetical protein